ncbi:MAG: enoyl-CoA hydratase [Alphaproteobacteria bacterium]|nr:enoyl-CoA hydratase [Alphaproteobacteria bacterium]
MEPAKETKISNQKLIAEKDGAIGWITFNNPAKHNAVSQEMWEGLADAVERFNADDDVRVIILKGAGEKAFVAGADISKFEDERGSEEAIKAYADSVTRGYDTLMASPKPTIAMIRGYCIGGGTGIAVCCDLRICAENAQLGIPAAKLGLGYSYFHIRKLVDLVGPSKAKEIFYTARRFSAAEAAEMGLANRVVSDGELEQYARDYAETIAGNAPLTVGSVKAIVGEIMKDPEAQDLDLCERLYNQCFDSEDYVEGRRAFMEKRKPNFAGR